MKKENILLIVLAVLLAISLFFNGWLFYSNKNVIFPPSNIPNPGCDRFTDWSNGNLCAHTCFDSQHTPANCVDNLVRIINACGNLFTDEGNMWKCKQDCTNRYNIINRQELLPVETAEWCAQWVADEINRMAELPNGSYKQTCRSCSLNGDILRCSCQDIDKSWGSSSVNLKSEDCLRRNDIENRYGNLECKYW